MTRTNEVVPAEETITAENLALEWRAFLRDIRHYAAIARERAAAREAETAKSEVTSEHKK
jgi:hypothetical protein